MPLEALPFAALPLVLYGKAAAAAATTQKYDTPTSPVADAETSAGLLALMASEAAAATTKAEREAAQQVRAAAVPGWDPVATSPSAWLCFRSYGCRQQRARPPPHLPSPARPRPLPHGHMAFAAAPGAADAAAAAAGNAADEEVEGGGGEEAEECSGEGRPPAEEQAVPAAPRTLRED
jgi:hypothetical protein